MLEDQNSALKAKVEELRSRIAAAASSESDLKDKLSGMNRSLKETIAASAGLEEELTRVRGVRGSRSGLWKLGTISGRVLTDYNANSHQSVLSLSCLCSPSQSV